MKSKNIKKNRTVSDSMGEVNVPYDAFYGAQTQRAVNNFPIRGRTNYPLLFDRNYQPKVAYERLLDVNTKP